MSTLPGWIVGLIALVLPGFGVAPEPSYNGYVEAEYLYVAAASAGRIEALLVREGDRITPGQEIFILEDSAQQATLRAAIAQVALASANLENLQTGGRAQEIAVIRAAIARVEAELQLAQSTLDRSLALQASGNVTTAQLDSRRAARDSAAAQLAQLQAELAVAELPARGAQQLAAEAALDAARAEVDRAEAVLAERHVRATIEGVVERVYFSQGEVAGAGVPIVAILPPEALKVLFFVPEPERMDFALGNSLRIGCDGCSSGVTARLSRLAASPQYTPPIIYSSEERTRLVYRAEAVLAPGSGLMAGQPVTVWRDK